MMDWLRQGHQQDHILRWLGFKSRWARLWQITINSAANAPYDVDQPWPDHIVCAMAGKGSFTTWGPSACAAALGRDKFCITTYPTYTGDIKYGDETVWDRLRDHRIQNSSSCNITSLVIFFIGFLTLLYYLKSDDVNLKRIRQINNLKQIILMLYQLILILQFSVSY